MNFHRQSRRGMEKPTMDLNFSADIVQQLNQLAREGKLVMTIDRGPPTDDCFYRVTTVTPSLQNFNGRQALVLWADPAEVWGDEA
jgi:hypothetical protein